MKTAPMKKKQRVRTAKDYENFEKAILTMREWAEEIDDELAKEGHSWKYRFETMQAADRVLESDPT